MATLIKNAKIAADSWQRLDWTTDGSLPNVPATGDVMVSLPLWQGKSVV